MNPDSLNFLTFRMRWVHLITLICLVLVSILSNFLVQVSYFGLFHKFAVTHHLDIVPVSLDAVRIAFWILLFLILRWIWRDCILPWIIKRTEKGYHFDSKKKKLSKNDFHEAWLTQGNSQISTDGLLISNSNSGCMIKPMGLINTINLWKNFTAKMDIEYPLQLNRTNYQPHSHDGKTNCLNSHCQYPFEHHLGIIFRAQNFSNYFMLEIVKNENQLIVRPHIRINGNWDAPMLNIDKNIIPVSATRFKLTINVDGNVVTITNGRSKILWSLPTHAERNQIQHEKEAKKSIELTTSDLVDEIYFRDRAGMFGFRCFGNQIALIKSLEITPIK